jgi:L-noviosyl transferase
VSWLPVGAAARHCDLVVHHGGSGTTMSALAQAAPQVACPSILDQTDNARRIDALGAGRMVPLTDALEGTGALARAVRDVLNHPHYAKAAAALRDENDAAPSPARAAGPLLQHIGDFGER